MNKKTVTLQLGPGVFTSLLTVLFIGLKLGGVIDWSWLWVLSPLWLPFAFVFGVLLIVAIIQWIAWLSLMRR